MLIYVLKKKREHTTYDIRDYNRSNKERQRLQPLASIG